MIDVTIKDLVGKGNLARFDRYRAQHMYYTVSYQDTSYTFPVPLEDIQDATLNKIEKAITLMRYIRKAMEEGTLAEKHYA